LRVGIRGSTRLHNSSDTVHDLMALMAYHLPWSPCVCQELFTDKLLISAVQNIQVLLRYGSYFKTSPSAMIEQIKGGMTRDIRSFLDLKELMISKIGQRVLFGFIDPRLLFIEG
jgi:hypothetical protein